MRKYYSGITLFKLAGCLVVLLAHTMLIRYMNDFSNQQFKFLTPILGTVVPCFYVISGFLAYNGWKRAADARKYVKKYISRLSLLYGLFCMLFVVEHIIPELILNGLTLSNIALQARILIIAVVLNGPLVQLWFIPPLLFSMAVCYWLVYEMRALRLAVILAIAGFLLTLFVCGSFIPITNAIFDGFTSNDSSVFSYVKLFIYRYLGFGLTFVLAGIWIAKYEEKFYQWRAWPFIIGTVVLTTAELLILLNYAEWSNDYKLALSILPSTLLLFYGILHIKWKAVQTYHAFINLFSIVTFVGHIPFMRVNLLLFDWDIASMSVYQDIIYLTLSLLECLALTVILYKRKRRVTLQA